MNGMERESVRCDGWCVREKDSVQIRNFELLAGFLRQFGYRLLQETITTLSTIRCSDVGFSSSLRLLTRVSLSSRSSQLV
jgi:hypothetical protein